MRPSRRTKPLWFRILGGFFYVFFLLAVLLCGTAYGFGLFRPGSFTAAVIGDMLHHQPPQQVFGQDTLTILVLGCDEDVSTGGRKVLKAQARSDMMLVVRLDFKHSRVGGISIPRDLLWGFQSYGRRKINAYHALGGNDLAKAATEDLLNIKIDRVVALNFDAFQEMVNLVGGVDVFVQKDMDYDDNAGHLHIHIKAGRQHLNGYDAMGFVGMRHSDSDFMRQQRQKDFMIAFKQKMAAKKFMLNKVAEKAEQVMGDVFSSAEMVSVAKFVQKMNSDSIKMGMVPIIEGPSGTGYGYYVELDSAKLPDALREFHMVDEPAMKVSLSR